MCVVYSELRRLKHGYGPVPCFIIVLRVMFETLFSCTHGAIAEAVCVVYLHFLTRNEALWVSILLLGILWEGPTADARIQRIEELVQPAVARLASWHLK